MILMLGELDRRHSPPVATALIVVRTHPPDLFWIWIMVVVRTHPLYFPLITPPTPEALRTITLTQTQKIVRPHGILGSVREKMNRENDPSTGSVIILEIGEQVLVTVTVKI